MNTTQKQPPTVEEIEVKLKEWIQEAEQTRFVIQRADEKIKSSWGLEKLYLQLLRLVLIGCLWVFDRMILSLEKELNAQLWEIVVPSQN